MIDPDENYNEALANEWDHEDLFDQEPDYDDEWWGWDDD